MKSIFQKDIKAIHILEELKCCNIQDNTSKVKELMENNDFDIIGVKNGDIIEGYFKLDDLKKGEKILFGFDDLIEDSTPLINVLSYLKEKPRIFVIIDENNYGIITHSDLQKIAVRIFLFGLISLLEMRISNSIRFLYRDNEWKKFIKNDRFIEIKERYNKQKLNKENLDLLECSELSDKAKIITQSPIILKDLNYSNTKFKKIMGSCINLRNDLAHSKDLKNNKCNDYLSWVTIIELSENIPKLLEKFDKREKGV